MNSRILGNNTIGNQIVGTPSPTVKQISGSVKKDSNLTGGKNRKTLQTIQPTASNKPDSSFKPLVKLNMNPLSPLTPKRVNVYQDPEPKKKDDHEPSEEIDQEAHELMVQENIPETYWKEIAEQRRQALAEALQENEQLHRKVEKLEDEKNNLKEMADQAEYFAGIIKNLLDEQNDSGVGSELHVTQDEIHDDEENGSGDS